VPRLVATIAGASASPQFLISAEALKQRGLAEAAAAGAPDGGKTPLASSAEHDLTTGLARAPADPEAWAAVAALRGADGAPALAMSLATGPGEGPEFWSRLELCLAAPQAIGGVLDPSLVQEQIRIGWGLAPERLVALVHRHSAVALAQAALAGRPDADRFAALIAAPP
jgi:hypothetical protein